MKKQYLLLTIILLFLSIGAFQPFGCLTTISGIVTDSDTKPIEGANVTIEENEEYNDITNENGVYAIPNVPYKTHTIKVTFPGYNDERKTITTSYFDNGISCENVDGDIQLSLVEQGGTLGFVMSIGDAGTGNGEFNFGGSSVNTIFHDGTYLYVTDYNNHRIQKFNNNGIFVSWFGKKAGNYGFFTSGSSEESGYYFETIQFDSNGNLYTGVGFSPGSLYRFHISSNTFISVSNASGVARLDSNDNIFSFKNSALDTIVKCNNSGTILLEFGGFGSADGKFQNDDFSGFLVIDSSNNVYATDLGGERIQKFDNNGNFILKWTETCSGWSSGTFCIGIDENDNIYTFDISRSVLKKYSTEGVLQKEYEIPSGYLEDTATHDFVVQANKIYFLVRDNSQIIVFSIPE